MNAASKNNLSTTSKRLRLMHCCVSFWVLTVSCVPAFDDETSRVETTRILAVRSEPAEPKAGERVTLSALLARVDRSDQADEQALAWYACTVRRPATELGPVAQECLTEVGANSDTLQSIGHGTTVSWIIERDVCRRFGPLSPPSESGGGEPGRPATPDQTGGYYQPIVADASSGTERAPVLGAIRLSCGGSAVPQKHLVEFNRGYRQNENPEIQQVSATLGDQPVVLDGPGPIAVPAGAQVTWNLSWASCPEAPVCGDGMCTVTENASDCVRDCQTEPVRGCTGPERYLLADPKTKTIVQHMETLAVSWFATHGTFEFSRTDNEQSPSSSSNTWTAPSVASPVRLWFVLRDSRRGVAWRELDVVVED